MNRSLCAGTLLWVAACSVAPPAAEPPVIHVRFDPEEGVLPLPTDILRDEEAGLLDIPAEPEDVEDKTDAEVALIKALNLRDGWPTRTTAEFELSGPIDPDSITADSIRVFVQTQSGLQPVDVKIEASPAKAPTEVSIPPPEQGWLPGKRYVAIAIGGPDGLVGLSGEAVVADAAFYFLRTEKSLLDHVDAIPGDTDADKLEAAEKLEEIRLSLAPDFDHMKVLGIQRDRIVALWSFTISRAPEVVMDKDLGKMPLPSDFLRDPATGLVDLPITDEDDDYTTYNKTELNKLDGFGLSSNLTFEVSQPLIRETITATTVLLFAMRDTLEAVAVDFDFRDGGKTILLIPQRPLRPETDHLVVITKGAKASEGRSVLPMLPGELALLDTPISVGGVSMIDSVDDESAARVEPMRATVRRGLEQIDVDVAAAWSFKTMSIVAPMLDARNAAARLNTPVDPQDIKRKGPAEAAFDFLAGALTVLRISDVYEGTITVPDFIDPVARTRRADGQWSPRKLTFTMTIPRRANENEPLKVVIFGHGLMADRRFVMSVADALASEGIAGIAVDFPFHGERSACGWSGPNCLVNPFNLQSNQICPPSCRGGTMCAEDGRCVDSAGAGNELANWPLVNYPTASGGAFVQVDNLPGTRDNIYQGVTELAALRRSLLEGDWKSAIGYDVNPKIGYVGQSLGGIMGTLFAAAEPKIERVVLNVPGGDLVELFRNSQVFGAHIDWFVAQREVEPGSTEHEQFMNVARWLVDRVDPQNFAPYVMDRNIETGLELQERKALMQMARFDLIIPNENTRLLQELTGVPMVEYIAEHAFLVVPIEPAFIRGTLHMSRLLGRGELP